LPKLEATVGGAIPGFRFRIDALGFSIGQAASIAGLSVNTEVVTYRGGADSNTFRKQKGLTTYDDVTIERIHTDNFDTWAMLGLVFEPTAGLLGFSSPIYKTDILITLLDLQGNERVRYSLKNAWIKGYEITQLDSNSSEYAVERVIFAHEGITKLDIQSVFGVKGLF
jgi:phage tail-like protein